MSTQTVYTTTLLLLICSTLGWLSCAANSPLSASSFSVKTRIYKIGLDRKIELLLEESYSKQQNRAKFSYHAPQSRAPSEYHYDAYSQHGLLYSQAEDTCEELNLFQFYTSKLYFADKLTSLMQLQIPNSNPVVGPAKLLLLVADRATQLKQQADQLVYGIDVAKYTLEVPLPGGTELTLSVYYDKITHDASSHVTDQFPAFIQWEGLWFHYFQFKHINEQDSQVTGRRSDGQESDDIVLDQFALPTASKCLQILPKYQTYSLYDMQSVRFSFEAETVDSRSGYLENHWVQYDGLLQAMRVDSHHQHASDLKSSIFNLRTNRRFVVTSDESGKESRCLVMKNLGKERLNMRLAHLLVGPTQMGLVGKAKVRGIGASVYGALSDRLPYWLDQPALYQYDGTKEALRRRGVSPSFELAEVKNSFKVLSYFDENKQDRLLAIEVFEVEDQQRLLFQIHFRDFAWRLMTEAPDGSPAGEIFALADSCSARPKENHYLELDLLLRQEQVSAIADSSSRASWIQDWPARDSSLLVGLVDTMDLDVTMVHDLGSSIKSRDHLLAIGVKFRLGEQSQLLRQLRLVARANIRPSSNSHAQIAIKHKGSALLLTDCLTLAAAGDHIQSNPTYIYFSEQHSACLMDPSLDGLEDSELIGMSLVFELVTDKSAQATGELYKVETHLEDSLSTGLVKEKKLKTLADRVLFLSHTTGQSAQPIDPAVFRMRVEQMKITNINYHRQVQDSNSSALQSVYAGIALRESGATTLISEADSLGECQAACLADYNCQAFSFCAQFPESECILSNVPIISDMDEAILASPNQRLVGFEVKLRRDLRCELHRKSYSSQFTRGGSERNVLNGHWIVPVASVEQCAQSCFMKTMELLTRTQMIHDDRSVRVLKQVCSRFLYLNSVLGDSQQEVVRDTIVASLPGFDVGGHLGGFCLIKDDLKGATIRLEPHQLTVLSFEYYDFDFSSLYEKKFGISLADTSTDLEKATQRRLLHEESEEEHYEILERAYREGRNVQAQVPSISEQLCARKCLLQNVPLLPTCRSFDVMRVRSEPAGATSSSYLVCVFNTKLANETQLEHQNGSTASAPIVERWHFEPRWDLLRHAIDSRTRWSSSHKSANASGWLQGGFIVMLLIVFAKMSGFVLGCRLTKRLLERSSEPEPRIIADHPLESMNTADSSTAQ